MDKKICPLMSGNVAVSMNDFCQDVIVSEFNEVECKKSGCQFWSTTPTTEGNEVYDCAIALTGMSGKIQV